MFDNLSLIRESYSVAFADYVRVKEVEGRRIIKMQTGDPDFATHPNIVSAAAEALQKGETKYCDSRGLLPLRKALIEKLGSENNIQGLHSDNILVTHGAVHGINMAIRALVNTGDECIILEPYWRSYEANVILAGGKPVILQTKKEDGFQLNAAAVLEKITPLTKLIIINTPNNPSGAVYHKNELSKLAKGAAEKYIFILSDEVYETLTFDEREHYSAASDPSVFDWIISVFSFSKTHAMTGWRTGYLVAQKIIIDEILKLSQFSVTSLAPYNQVAALIAVTDPLATSYAEMMRREYEKRRNLINKKIKNTWLENVATIPGGAFYILIDVAKFHVPSLELAKMIVDFADVSFTPGIAFGNNMDNYLRMCFATSNENILIALDALIRFEKKYTDEN